MDQYYLCFDDNCSNRIFLDENTSSHSKHKSVLLNDFKNQIEERKDI